VDDVSGFLLELEPDPRAIVDALRGVVRKVVPDAAETVLWGGLSYHTPCVGGRVRGAVCQITAKRGEVRLEFIHGVRLADPSRLLRGTRLSKRYVPVGSAAEARKPGIRKLVLAASEIGVLCQPQPSLATSSEREAAGSGTPASRPHRRRGN
jgi:hypothetical protein